MAEQNIKKKNRIANEFNDFRHISVKRFIKASGSAGMASIVMDCPNLIKQARFMIDEEAN